MQLANAIVPLIEDPAPLEQALATYASTFEQAWQSMMAQKLGLDRYAGDGDAALIAELTEILQLVETDMTIFFRRLADVAADREPDDARDLTVLADAYYVPSQLTVAHTARITRWLHRYRARLRDASIADHERKLRMNAVNPKYVLRNYLAQVAIDKAEAGDYDMVSELLGVLRRPYDEQIDKEQYAARRPDWARSRAGCSMLSCSS